jgi:NAD(P)-dependent dehydrogenase (short-subunit alcohol dehydrogenase family)
MRSESRPVAVVTGASAGVGRATAIEFAARGFDVALLARGDAGLYAAAEEVRVRGAVALPVSVDVASCEEVDEAADAVERELGPISCWVNNAMTTVFAPLGEVRPAEFQRAIEVTFLGQVWGTMAALRRMRPRDDGTIVNVGSALAFIGIPLQSAYCSAKFACRGFFESTRSELLHEGSNVRLCMVHLPAVNTPQFDWCVNRLPYRAQPVPPIYQPETPARFIVDSALTGRRSKVVGSWNKALVVGATLAPGFGDHYAAAGAWESQLTDEPVDPDARFNLWHPVDDTHDVGRHGRFDDVAGGFTDRSFLVSLPKNVGTFGVALGRRIAERAMVSRRQLRLRRRRRTDPTKATIST